MKPRILSLCSGYGGLDMAIEDFFGAETAAFAEYEAAPSKVLAHHWPDVPNLGDMTTVDWATLSDIDIIAGGTPCQDLSAAGKRAGMTEGTRSNLWVQMREAVAILRPSLVVWENVRGAYSARADSEVEREPGLLGDGAGGPALRALGRVLGDLASLGYDAEWVGVRASDAGAPHARFRVFVLAYSDGVRRGEGWAESAGRFGRLAPVVGGASTDASSVSGSFGDGDDVCPRCGAVGRRQAAGRGAAPDTSGSGRDGRAQDTLGEPLERAAASGRGRAAGAPADTGCARLGEHAGKPSAEEARPAGGDVTAGAGGSRPHQDWGPYQPAIERWEHVLGRVAPAPTNPDGRNGGHRLASRFVEWMMGAPEGHVTAPEIGLSRNEQLKALGNGVVPQQAHLALSLMWPRVLEAVVA